MIIDTHCHLNDSVYNDDFDIVYERAHEAGVGAFVIPGADIADLKRAVLLSEKFDDIYFAVGIHPYHIDDFDLKVLQKYAIHKKCVAIGECGLDYFRLPKDESQKQGEKLKQKDVFISQINLAIDLKLPLIVHSREANEDTYQILSTYANKLSAIILHCYNSSPLLLELTKFHNVYYGIGGVLTFKNAKNLVSILPKIPQDRLVIETDAPYLTPEPYRGKRNEPAYTDLVCQKIGEILNLKKEMVCEITTQNARRIFDKF